MEDLGDMPQQPQSRGQAAKRPSPLLKTLRCPNCLAECFILSPSLLPGKAAVLTLAQNLCY